MKRAASLQRSGRSSVDVIFSELALTGLLKAEPNPDRRKSIVLSLQHHLRHPEAPSRCVRLFQFTGSQLYLYSFWKFRVIWEIAPAAIFVWSVSLLKDPAR
jgi:hypothetical protein